MPFGKPSNKILVAGQPKGTADHQVVLAGDGEKNPVGVADYMGKQPITDAYPDKESIRVLKGSIVVVATLASGNNVAKGAPLVCAANGKLKAAADISVSVPSGTTTVTSNAAQPDLMEIGSIPPYGVIVGFAEESVDASAGDKPIMVRLVI